MFEGLKKLIGDSVADLTASANVAQPDLMAVPAAATAGAVLSALPLDVLSAYLGLEVTEVRPVDPPTLGTGAVLDALTSHGYGGRDFGSAFQALLTGENEKRDEILRKHGISSEDVAVMREHATDATERYRASGWTFDFVRGKSLSVRLFTRGDSEAGFDTMKAHEAFQRTQIGAEQRHDNIFTDHIRPLRGGPYESYYGPGYLTSRGREHDARAEGFPGVRTENEIRAGIAALALRCVEGP